MTTAAPLRILAANDRLDRLFLLVDVLIDLGHDVIAQQLAAEEVAAATAHVLPDVVLVGMGAGPGGHLLDGMPEMAHNAACPVIALLDPGDPASVGEAARLGIAAAVLHEEPEELRDAIDAELRRLADYRALRQAMSRRAAIEHATELLITRRQEQMHETRSAWARDAGTRF